MNIRELREKSESDLQKLLAQTREELRALRFRVRAGQFKDVSRIKQVRRTTARILSLLAKVSKEKGRN